MSLAQGCSADQCCKLGNKGARCASLSCVLADVDLRQCAIYLRAYRVRLGVQAQGTRDANDKADLLDLIVNVGVQIAALEQVINPEDSSAVHS